MAGHEVVTPLSVPQALSEVERVVGGFREYYAGRSSHELERVPLVSAHDPTIRFTNSTTSVGKGYLRGDLAMPESGVYLAQPAMGAQGINYWLQTRSLGEYASYFTSLGCLYEPTHGKAAVEDMARIAQERWGIAASRLRVEVHEQDTALTGLVEAMGLAVHVFSDDDVSPFRHVYGMPGVGGINANMRAVDDNGNSLGIGNLTRIQTDEEAAGIAWEVSFDSAPVIATRRTTGHAIAASAAVSLVGEHVAGPTEALVAADCATISAALMLEGMEPRSKGRAGVLRKFFKEYVVIMRTADAKQADAADLLMDVAQTEVKARRHMSPEATSSVDLDRAGHIARDWIDRLWQTAEV